jgi:hypothetical protein
MVVHLYFDATISYITRAPCSLQLPHAAAVCGVSSPLSQVSPKGAMKPSWCHSGLLNNHVISSVRSLSEFTLSTTLFKLKLAEVLAELESQNNVLKSNSGPR